MSISIICYVYYSALIISNYYYPLYAVAINLKMVCFYSFSRTEVNNVMNIIKAPVPCFSGEFNKPRMLTIIMFNGLWSLIIV